MSHDATVALVQRLHEHRMWCNRQLRDAARPLTFEQLQQSFDIGQGNVLATLAHLYAAEFVWLEALNGNATPVSPFKVTFDNFADLETAWDALDERWRTYLAGLTAATLEQPVTKQSTSSGAGKMWVTPARDVLLHVCTHAQYTTAQAANMLRHLGVTPPDTMLITFSRSQFSQP